MLVPEGSDALASPCVRLVVSKAGPKRRALFLRIGFQRLHSGRLCEQGYTVLL